MSSYPYIPFTNKFNPNDFTEIDGSLSLADADLRYFKISGGTITGFCTFLNSLDVIGTLSINSVPINLSLISGVTAGTTVASKVLSLDASSNINGNISVIGNLTATNLTGTLQTVAQPNITSIGTLTALNVSGITSLTPTNYGSSPNNIDGCIYRTISGRIFGFRELSGSTSWAWGWAGGGSYNDYLTLYNTGTYRMTLNGNFNASGYYLSGTVVLDSSRNLTCNSASVRNNSQTSGTRVEYLSIGRETGSDYGAWSLQNYYQSATSQQANYCTFTPSLKTSLTSGYGICFNQSGQVSFQDVNAGSGSGGIKTASNIVGCVDIYGGVSRTISAGNGELRNNATPAIYNAGTISTRIGLYVENSVWCASSVYSSSDIRLKRDIEPIGLDEAKKLLNINSVSYRWKKDTEDHMPDIGFVAQDLIDNGLDKLVSFCPNNNKDDFPEGYNYGIEYNRVSIYLLELIKDLYKQIDELKKN